MASIFSKSMVDAHHHLWDLRLHKNRWLIDQVKEYYLGDYSAIRRSYLLEDFLQDIKAFSLKKSVHLQAGWENKDALGESQWLAKISQQSGFPTAIVGYVDLSDDSKKVESLLAAHATFPQMRGIRQIINWHEDPYYRGCDKNYIEIASWQKNLRLLKKYSLTFDLQIYPEQVASLYPLLAQYDDINMVIDHALMPIQRSESYLSFWEKQLEKLSSLPHLYIKISGIGMFDHQWTIESFKRVITPVINIFSPTRCMVGSNFPVDKLFGSFDHIMGAYREILAAYSENEQENILSITAEKFYRL